MCRLRPTYLGHLAGQARLGQRTHLGHQARLHHQAGRAYQSCRLCLTRLSCRALLVHQVGPTR